MRVRQAFGRGAIGLAFACAALAFQRPFHQFPGVEYPSFEVPEDWNHNAEFAFARLMYPPGPLDGYYPRYQGDWRRGLSLWTQDYPRADRHFSRALRRLTRIHVRSVEQPVNLEEAMKRSTGRGSTRCRWASGG